MNNWRECVFSFHVLFCTSYPGIIHAWILNAVILEWSGAFVWIWSSYIKQHAAGLRAPHFLDDSDEYY